MGEGVRTLLITPVEKSGKALFLFATEVKLSYSVAETIGMFYSKFFFLPTAQFEEQREMDQRGTHFSCSV
jgi:hypothetical protein